MMMFIQRETLGESNNGLYQRDREATQMGWVYNRATRTGIWFYPKTHRSKSQRQETEKIRLG